MSDQKTAAPHMIEKSDAEWQRILSPEAYRVLRKHGTERAGSSPLNAEKRDGVFICAGCGTPLYDPVKFESGTAGPALCAKDGAVERAWTKHFHEAHRSALRIVKAIWAMCFPMGRRRRACAIA